MFRALAVNSPRTSREPGAGVFYSFMGRVASIAAGQFAELDPRFPIATRLSAQLVGHTLPGSVVRYPLPTFPNSGGDKPGIDPGSVVQFPIPPWE